MLRLACHRRGSLGRRRDLHEPAVGPLSVLKEAPMTFIYRGILLFMLVFVLRSLFREKSFLKQLADTLVVIPMVLRILMIK